MAAGDFTASALADVLVKADNIWADNMSRPDYEADVDAFLAIQAEQTANVSLSEGDKDVVAKIVWINACGMASAAQSDDCTISGSELESDSDSNSLTLTRKVDFFVKEKAFRANTFDREEVVAKGMLKASKILDEYITQQGITRINSFGGTVNAYSDLGTLASGVVTVPLVNWTIDLIPDLILAGKLNKFSNPFILSGSNLWKSWWNAMMDSKNADGDGDGKRTKAIRSYFDLINMDTVTTPDKKTFLVNRGAIAFASKAYYDPTPTVYSGFGQTRWSIASNALPGVRYDVHYTNSCTSNEITHKFSVNTKFDYWLNPTGCTAGNTGVLVLKKGS